MFNLKTFRTQIAYAKCDTHAKCVCEMFKNENESCHVIELAEIQFKIVYGAMTTAGNEYLSIYSNCTPKQYTHCKMVALREIKLI